MTKFIIGLSLLFTSSLAHGQGLNASYLYLKPGSLPSICRQGEVRVNASGVFEVCGSTNTWGAIPTTPTSVANGGTGVTTLTTHGVLIGEGTSNVATVSPSSTTGAIFVSGGASADPAYSTVLAKSGTLQVPDGSNTNPSLTFASETNSGFYRAATGDVVLMIDGVQAVEMLKAGSNVNWGFGPAGTVGNTATNPFSMFSSNNGIQYWQFGNTSAGASSVTSFQILNGTPNLTNATEIGNGANLSSGYLAGGSWLSAASNQLQLNLMSEFSGGAIVFNVGGRTAATEAMRLVSSGSTGLTLNKGWGTLNLSGSSSGAVTIQPQAAAGTYNFNLPTTAGTAGWVMTSAGGGSNPMTWTNLSATTGTTPAGTVIDFIGQTCPTGYLQADGTTVSRTTYAILYGVTGNSFGNGDGSTTFTLPDLRGNFTRGMDLTATNDPDDASRTAQTSGTLTVGSGSVSNGSATVNISTTELVPGMTVTGTDIPANTVVRSITDSTHFVMGDKLNTSNVTATGTASSLILTFSRSAIGNYLGSTELSAYLNHTHSASSTSTSTIASSGSSGGGFADTGGGTANAFGASTNTYAGQISTAPASGATYVMTSTSTTVNASTTGSTETRPRNVYVLKCIRTGL